MHEESLDPEDWPSFRAQAHLMLDDVLDHVAQLRDGPVWQPPPSASREALTERLPRLPMPLAAVHQTFMTHILPYGAGNAHPGFMGWVQGGGTPVGMLAEMLAAGLNANLGGRHQMPVHVERQVTAWTRELFGFPPEASGLFVTGTSMANLLAVLIARRATLGEGVRQAGLTGEHGLVAYASSASHGCVAQAMDLSGLGRGALRLIPVNDRHQMDLASLRAAVAQDLASGLRPFAVIATAGSVDTGAIDELQAIADIAQAHGLWMHVDGAFGALGMLSPRLAPLLDGLQRANSIAFDFHKWGQVPYDAGFLLVRDGAMHQATFAAPAAYLRREARGLSADSPWPCDFGPDLSRGFRALKTWFTLKTYGADRLGRMIAHTCDLARHLAGRIADEPRLELLAPVALNIVCFRYLCADADADRINADIVVAVQEAGVCAPSSTTIQGRFAIRAAIVNHRTTRRDVDALVDEVLAHGERLCSEVAA